jgi:transketolase
MKNSYVKNSFEERLDSKSLEIRDFLLEKFKISGKGHLGSAFSLIELLRVLFDKYIKFDPLNNNNRLIISQGWASLVYYYFLAEAKQIEANELDTFIQFESKLGGCIESTINGIVASTGSCGHGLPIGVGLAYANKINKNENKIFVIIGDGEMGEGSIWEALMSASRKKLDNLIVIVDYNKIQCSGDVESITSIEPIKEKILSFGFDFFEVNGHSITDLENIFDVILNTKSNNPKFLVSHSIMGKGLISIENSANAHWVGKIDAQKLIYFKEELFR